MRIIKYRTFGKSTPSDPEGVTDLTQTSELIDAILLDNGNILIKEYNIEKINCQEGNNPGEWQSSSQTQRAVLNSIKSNYPSLIAGSSPYLSKILEAIKAYITNKDKGACVSALLPFINNINKTDEQRAIALICLALLLGNEDL